MKNTGSRAGGAALPGESQLRQEMPGEVGPGQGLGWAQRGGILVNAGGQWEISLWIFQTVGRGGEGVCIGLDRAVLDLGPSDLTPGQQLSCHCVNPVFRAHVVLSLAVPAHLVTRGQPDVGSPCPPKSQCQPELSALTGLSLRVSMPSPAWTAHRATSPASALLFGSS